MLAIVLSFTPAMASRLARGVPGDPSQLVHPVPIGSATTFVPSELSEI